MIHDAYIRHIPESPCAVLMIHGILGSPIQFRDLLPEIPADWSVYNILLEGHSGSVQDFAHASMANWERQVQEYLDSIFREHRHLLIVGHSMGCLFALDAAIRFPRQVERLFLLQPPLKLRVSPSIPIRSLLVALGRTRPGTRAAAMAAATGITMTPKLLQYLGWIPRYLELFRKIAETNKRISSLAVPTEAFLSTRDELVSTRSAGKLPNREQIRITQLPTSSHYAYSAPDTVLLRQHLARHVQDIEKNSHR